MECGTMLDSEGAFNLLEMVELHIDNLYFELKELQEEDIDVSKQVEIGQDIFDLLEQRLCLKDFILQCKTLERYEHSCHELT